MMEAAGRALMRVIAGSAGSPADPSYPRVPAVLRAKLQARVQQYRMASFRQHLSRTKPVSEDVAREQEEINSARLKDIEMLVAVVGEVLTSVQGAREWRTLQDLENRGSEDALTLAFLTILLKQPLPTKASHPKDVRLALCQADWAFPRVNPALREVEASMVPSPLLVGRSWQPPGKPCRSWPGELDAQRVRPG